MKKYLFYILFTVIGFSSCKEMDSEYKEFIIPNGLTYPQKADSLKAYPGYHKLRLKWMKPKSPTVKYAMVYWNNYTDSLKVNIPDSGDTLIVDINDLTENSYSFYVKNFDDKGNISLPAEVTGTPYGDNFLISASDRTYLNATRDASFTGTINWGVKTSNLAYTEVRYKTATGGTNTLRVKPEESVLNLPNIKIGEKFEYRSVFLPPNGIDYIARDWQTSDSPFLYKFPRNTWTAEARNGNHAWGDGGGGQPILLFDGNMTTGWHSKVGTPLPQCVVADMKESQIITNVTIYPPEKTSWRYMNKVEVYVSETPIVANAPQPSWGAPVAKATYAGTAAFKMDLNAPTKGRYIAVVFLDSKSNTYISFMEFEAYGY